MNTLLEDDNPNFQDDPYFKQLVEEAKKDPETIAKRKYDSDKYIKTMEQRSDELRDDYRKLLNENTARANLQELVDKLSKQQTTSSDITSTANDVRDNMKPFDPNEIKSLVSESFKEITQKQKEEQNFSKVRDKLKEQFGPNYSVVLKDKIDELGMTSEHLDNLARTAPNAVIKMFEQPKQDTFQAPPRGSSTTMNNQRQQEKRSWSYYQNLRKTDPRAYYDPKTTVQMHKDYETLGREFEDGDFLSHGQRSIGTFGTIG